VAELARLFVPAAYTSVTQVCRDSNVTLRRYPRGIPMAKVIEAREPSKRPTCPHCGDARIALMKAPDPHGRNVWWLTCHACGDRWQPVASSIPARAVV
jgi:hypothetical protein